MKRPRCCKCRRNLLAENAWLSGPAGDICLPCEDRARRRAAIAELSAATYSRAAAIRAEFNLEANR